MVCLDNYVKASDEWILKVVGEMLQVGETKNKYGKQVEKVRKRTFWEKRLHGKFMRDVNEEADERLW